MKKNELHDKIEQALRAERPLLRAPAGFSDRVIQALPNRPLLSGSAPRRPGVAVWPRFSLAFGLALAAFVLWRGFAPKLSPEPVIAKSSQPTDSILPGAGFKTVSVEQVQALTVKIDQPLEKELERVMADTRNAIRFVAANFMPDQN